MTFAESERSDLAELLLAVGPEAPTLCEGWNTRDLANHLYIRENRPDALGGIFVPALKGRLDAVTEQVGEMPYETVVRRWGSGAPKWSPMRWADSFANTAENFIHHEDVRRAREGWTVRDLPPSATRELWKIVTVLGKLLLRKSTVSVTVVRPDGLAATLVDRSDRGAGVVTIRGEVSELALWLYGRDQAQVTIEGDDAGIVRGSL
nr:TIGR03085 family metal-binding protein [Corynebacterium lactis]